MKKEFDKRKLRTSKTDTICLRHKTDCNWFLVRVGNIELSSYQTDTICLRHTTDMIVSFVKVENIKLGIGEIELGSYYNNLRKNTFKKSSGFSRYDNMGNVIYSESIGKNGETVRHFYKYDDFGRRIEYSELDENSNIIIIEHTSYENNGNVYKYIWDDIHHTSTIMIINSMGRTVYSKFVNSDTGQYTINTYNNYKDRNDRETGIDLFTLNFKSYK